MRLVGFAFVVASVWADRGDVGNLNGNYVLSATPGSDPSKFVTSFPRYPRKPQYFEVYSPLITSLYSQVFWKTLETVPLPADIVKNFSGKAMAVVGFEMDQVRRTAGGDVSVPINVAYNHHFESTMLGASAEMVKIKVDKDAPDKRIEMGGHGRPEEGWAWVVEDDTPPADNEVPHSQSFGAGNGGEYRKSFHGWAPGYAHPIQSPHSISITPMQIDTWHRERMNLTGSAFVPGPLPRNSLSPTTGVDAKYSGLLECPLTTRITKVYDSTSFAAVHGTCANQITTAPSCEEDSKHLSFPPKANVSFHTGTDAQRPQGCSVTLLPSGEFSVYFNTLPDASKACGNHAKVFRGRQHDLVDVEVEVDASKDQVTLTLEGPSDVWFGVGFNATKMGDQPWAVIVDGTGEVSEHQLNDQGKAPTTDSLPSSIHAVSSSVTNKMRKVVLTRPIKGMTSQYYTFNPSIPALPFINAVGTGPSLAYHKAHSSGTLLLLPVSEPACVCKDPPPPFGQQKGQLQYQDGGKVSFGNHCPPPPDYDLLAQHNPTCDLRTYVGGQTACHHMWSLLDADQDIPWQDKPLEYHLKFRFWYEEYDPSYHHEIHRTTWGMASPVEYDVPQCASGTPTKDCVHTIRANISVPSNQKYLVSAHFHCHAPTCLSVALYDRETGNLLCEEKPLYGGHGEMGGDKFEEPGFIAVPPCLWGSADHGFAPPPLVGGRVLHAVKTSNSTYGHHGEMAWLQVFTVPDAPTHLLTLEGASCGVLGWLRTHRYCLMAVAAGVAVVAALYVRKKRKACQVKGPMVVGMVPEAYVDSRANTLTVPMKTAA